MLPDNPVLLTSTLTSSLALKQCTIGLSKVQRRLNCHFASVKYFCRLISSTYGTFSRWSKKYVCRFTCSFSLQQPVHLYQSLLYMLPSFCCCFSQIWLRNLLLGKLLSPMKLWLIKCFFKRGSRCQQSKCDITWQFIWQIAVLFGIFEQRLNLFHSLHLLTLY